MENKKRQYFKDIYITQCRFIGCFSTFYKGSLKLLTQKRPLKRKFIFPSPGRGRRV